MDAKAVLGSNHSYESLMKEWYVFHRGDKTVNHIVQKS